MTPCEAWRRPAAARLKVLRVSVPGAAMSTLVFPQLEKLAFASFWSLAATHTTLSTAPGTLEVVGSHEQGNVVCPETWVSLPLLPAEITKSTCGTRETEKAMKKKI